MEINDKNLLQILDNLHDVIENEGLDFKGVEGGFPGSFWETYSAFANSNGGVIVIGLKEKRGVYRRWYTDVRKIGCNY